MLVIMLSANWREAERDIPEVQPPDDLLEKRSVQETPRHYYFFEAQAIFCLMSLQLHHFLKDLKCADTVDNHLIARSISPRPTQN